MKRYDWDTIGKLVIQDWDNVSGYPDTPLLWILSRQQAAMLVALCPPQKWLTRWTNPPVKDTLDAFIAETMFNLMNPITCAMLQECLQELFDAQTLEFTNIVNNVNNFGTSTPGLPMTVEEMAENLAAGTNPACDYDILWAQCLAIVQYTNGQIVDLLEKVEAATNINELLGLIDTIPLLGWVAEFFGSALATDTINYFQEAIQEGYLAQYTEGVENELAAGLFCLAIFDCELNLNLVYDFLFSRVTGLVPSNPGEVIDLLEMLAGIDFDGTNVVDLMFWFCWGAVKLASFIFEPVTTATFETITALAVDNASPDWLILADCGSDWNYELDSTTNPVWALVPHPGNEGTIGGNVLTQTTVGSVTGITVEITFPTVQHLTGLQIISILTENVEGATVGNAFWALRDTGGSNLLDGALPIINEPWEIFEGFTVSNVKKIVIIYNFVATDPEIVWQPVKIFGFGTNPFV